MTLNKQGNGKIDWTDYSWNPVSGCKHGCDYCYLKRMGERFKKDFMTPKFHSEKLNDVKKLKKPSKIFVCSSGDLFGLWNKNEIIEKVIKVTRDNPQHTFQFLTKNPTRYWQFDFPDNCWLGTTVDGTEKTIKNLIGLGKIRYLDRDYFNTKITLFASFEPLLTDVCNIIVNSTELYTHFKALDWIIIGANSNPGAKKPPNEWADDLIDLASAYDTPVWMKDNYCYPDMIKNFPEDECENRRFEL